MGNATSTSAGVAIRVFITSHDLRADDLECPAPWLPIASELRSSKQSQSLNVPLSISLDYLLGLVARQVASNGDSDLARRIVPAAMPPWDEHIEDLNASRRAKEIERWWPKGADLFHGAVPSHASYEHAGMIEWLATLAANTHNSEYNQDDDRSSSRLRPLSSLRRGGRRTPLSRRTLPVDIIGPMLYVHKQNQKKGLRVAGSKRSSQTKAGKRMTDASHFIALTPFNNFASMSLAALGVEAGDSIEIRDVPYPWQETYANAIEQLWAGCYASPASEPLVSSALASRVLRTVSAVSAQQRKWDAEAAVFASGGSVAEHRAEHDEAWEQRLLTPGSGVDVLFQVAASRGGGAGGASATKSSESASSSSTPGTIVGVSSAATSLESSYDVVLLSGRLINAVPLEQLRPLLQLNDRVTLANGAEARGATQRGVVVAVEFVSPPASTKLTATLWDDAADEVTYTEAQATGIDTSRWALSYSVLFTTTPRASTAATDASAAVVIAGLRRDQLTQVLDDPAPCAQIVSFAVTPSAAEHANRVDKMIIYRANDAKEVRRVLRSAVAHTSTRSTSACGGDAAAASAVRKTRDDAPLKTVHSVAADAGDVATAQLQAEARAVVSVADASARRTFAENATVQLRVLQREIEWILAELRRLKSGAIPLSSIAPTGDFMGAASASDADASSHSWRAAFYSSATVEANAIVAPQSRLTDDASQSTEVQYRLCTLPQHAHALSFRSAEYSGWGCDVCHGGHDSRRWRCTAGCDWDACVACVAAEMAKRTPGGAAETETSGVAAAEEAEAEAVKLHSKPERTRALKRALAKACFALLQRELVKRWALLALHRLCAPELWSLGGAAAGRGAWHGIHLLVGDDAYAEEWWGTEIARKLLSKNDGRTFEISACDDSSPAIAWLHGIEGALKSIGGSQFVIPCVEAALGTLSLVAPDAVPGASTAAVLRMSTARYLQKYLQNEKHAEKETLADKEKKPKYLLLQQRLKKKMQKKRLKKAMVATMLQKKTFPTQDLLDRKIVVGRRVCISWTGNELYAGEIIDISDPTDETSTFVVRYDDGDVRSYSNFSHKHRTVKSMSMKRGSGSLSIMFPATREQTIAMKRQANEEKRTLAKNTQELIRANARRAEFQRLRADARITQLRLSLLDEETKFREAAGSSTAVIDLGALHETTVPWNSHVGKGNVELIPGHMALRVVEPSGGMCDGDEEDDGEGETNRSTWIGVAPSSGGIGGACSGGGDCWYFEVEILRDDIDLCVGWLDLQSSTLNSKATEGGGAAATKASAPPPPLFYGYDFHRKSWMLDNTVFCAEAEAGAEVEAEAKEAAALTCGDLIGCLLNASSGAMEMRVVRRGSQQQRVSRKAWAEELPSRRSIDATKESSDEVLQWLGLRKTLREMEEVMRSHIEQLDLSIASASSASASSPLLPDDEVRNWVATYVASTQLVERLRLLQMGTSRCESVVPMFQRSWRLAGQGES